MQVPEGSPIELLPEGAQVGSTHLKYDDFPAFREQVQILVHDLVRRTQLSLFGHACGRCGNSCRRPNVLVREQDIFRMRFRLGLTEAELRERYLAPAPSWNPGDGFIRLENGHCPFLIEGVEGGVSACSIYEDRPLDCQSFRSDTPFCRKDPNRLIQDLAAIRLRDPGLEVELKGGQRHELPDERPFCELVRTQLELVEIPAEERLARVARRTGELIAETEPGEDLTKLRQLVSDLASLGGLDRHKPDVVGQLWSDLREREARPVPAPARPPRQSRVQWLQLTEEAVSALYVLPPDLRAPGQPEQIPVFLSLAQYPPIKARVHELMRALLTLNDEAFQQKLSDPDPPCFLCGECCRCYAVEITPSDIDRLAGHLGMTPAELATRYTRPGRYSWNPGNRILLKEEKVLRYTAANPRLVPLHVAPERFERGCVFLEERPDGFFYCQVHSHKPDVCRGYEPTHSLCRRTNQVQNWGRQARRVVWVQLFPDEAQVMAVDSLTRNEPAHALKRLDWPDLDEAALGLEVEVDEVLERARQELAHKQEV